MRLAIAVARTLFNFRPARIAQRHQLGRLVIGFTDRIVQSLAQKRIIIEPVNGEQLAMAARHQQKQIRKFNRLGEPR